MLRWRSCRERSEIAVVLSDIGPDNVSKSVCRDSTGADEEIISRLVRGKLTFATGARSLSRSFCAALTANIARCWDWPEDVVWKNARCWMCSENAGWTAPVLMVSSSQSMLNSSLGQGIIDTGCAKMIGSETFDKSFAV